jgi:hypothetical protein
MAEYSRLVDWQVRYATLIDAAENATAAYINILHNALQAKVKASLPPPEPTSSIAPPPPATPAGAPAPAPAP